MVRCDIQQDGDVGLEIIHVIELEGTQFDDIVVMILVRHLECQRIADISRQTHVQPCLFEDVEDKGGSGRLTVRTGDTDHLRLRITRCEFNLGDDRRTLRNQFLNERCIRRNTGRFNYFVGIQNEFLRVLAVFPCDAVLVQQRTIGFANRTTVRDEDVKAFLFRQNSCAGTTLAGS